MRAGGEQTQPSCRPSCTHKPWHPTTEAATQNVLEGKISENWGVPLINTIFKIKYSFIYIYIGFYYIYNNGSWTR